MRGWPDDGTGAAAPETDVDALVAWGRFTDADEALAHLEQALPVLEHGSDGVLFAESGVQIPFIRVALPTRRLGYSAPL